MYSGKFWRQVHCKNQVQKHSALTQCKLQCSEHFLNKLDLESSEVQNMKNVAV